MTLLTKIIVKLYIQGSYYTNEALVFVYLFK